MTASFTPRLTRPEAGNKYYITKAAGGYSDAVKGSPTDPVCNVLANCVGYAYGRFNEIVGEGTCKYLRPVNAENFIQYAGGLPIGQEPKLGACMVWQRGSTLKGADGAGHVAIVEKVVSATEVVTSESGWNAKNPFWTQTRKKGNGNWGQNSRYKFLGFIYNPAPCCKGTALATTVAKTEKGGTNMGFTNSPLATVKKISPNRTVNRNHVIDTITIHCYVGQVTAERGLNGFADESRGASCNYVIGHDGVIGLCVEEKDRSWCSGGYTKDKNGNKVPIRVNGISGKSNDYQAVTIEVASDSKHPYAITDKAMAALIELCADICRRNGIEALLWKGDKKLVGKVSQQNLTVHRWFARKACPGDYIYERLGDIAAKVNAKLGATPVTAPADPVSAVPYKVRITVTDLNIRKGPGTNNARAGVVKPGVYTIVSEATGKGATLWGKLKSGAGWVSLDYCKKI